MSKSIWKFPLKTTLIQQIEMPADAEILTLQLQYEIPWIWVLVSTDAPNRKFTFEIFSTGESMPENIKRKYIGTYQLNNSGLVFHCFELLDLI